MSPVQVSHVGAWNSPSSRVSGHFVRNDPRHPLADCTGVPRTYSRVLATASRAARPHPSPWPGRASRNTAANPSAWGQTITSTVTVRITPSDGSPSTDHAGMVQRCRARRDAQQRRRSSMPARAVSSPTASTRTRTDESVDAVPRRPAHRAGDGPDATRRCLLLTRRAAPHHFLEQAECRGSLDRSIAIDDAQLAVGAAHVPAGCSDDQFADSASMRRAISRRRTSLVPSPIVIRRVSR